MKDIDRVYIGPATFFCPIDGNVDIIALDAAAKKEAIVRFKIHKGGEVKTIRIPFGRVLYFMDK